MTLFGKTPKTLSRRTERCPVCTAKFGSRYFNEKKAWKCLECRATFTYLPLKLKPEALTDRQADQICRCQRCQN